MDIETFRKQTQALTRTSVDESTFLVICRAAIATVQKDWSAREEVARTLTGIWLSREDWPQAVDDIGNQFANLELPDVHIDQSDGLSVKERWQKLAEQIDASGF